MAFQYPKCRETTRQLCPIPNAVAKWSKWLELMVPGKDLGEGFLNRNDNQEGSYKSENLPGDDICGIYEWKVWKSGKGIIVYLGSSCNEGPAPLRNRILQYCRDGAHKHELINDALRKGYELRLRYRIFEGVGESKIAEDYLLKKYNYAWNEQNNALREPRIGKLHIQGRTRRR